MSGLFYCYESQTSDLKVWAEQSPLSRWSEVAIVKKLRFQIIFNRTQPDFGNAKSFTKDLNERFIKKNSDQTKKIIIRGNQNQLQELIAAIFDYVESQLNFTNFDFTNFDLSAEIKLFHRLSIPRLPKLNNLEFSTIELFDLCTNLELLSTSIQILPFDPVSVEHRNSMFARLKVATIAATILVASIKFSINFLTPETTRQEITASLPESAAKKEPGSPELLPNQSKIKAIKPTAPKNEPAKLQKTLPETLPPKLPAKFPAKFPTKLRDEDTKSPTLSQTIPPKSAPPNFSITPKTIKKDPVVPAVKQALIQPRLKSLDKSQEKSLDKSPAKTSTPELLVPPAVSGDSSGILAESPESKAQKLSAPEARKSSRSLPSLSENFSIRQKPNHPKITIIKISGTADEPELENYKHKLENLILPKPKSNPEINTPEIKIQAQWQNRQITKITTTPETSELASFIQQSLLENFLDSDGEIEVLLKITNF